MRGRLSTVDLYDVKPLVPDLYRPRVTRTMAYPAPKVIEGRVPRQQVPVLRAVERWVPRRWPTMLGDDLAPIQPRAQPEISFTPQTVPSTPAASSGGGFWANIASGLSNAVAGVLPAFAQVQTARLMTSQNAALLRQAGTQLYTPGNITTLQQQAEFEAAQRRIDQGRLTGATELPISSTLIIGGLLVGGLVWAVTRK